MVPFPNADGPGENTQGPARLIFPPLSAEDRADLATFIWDKTQRGRYPVTCHALDTRERLPNLIFTTSPMDKLPWALEIVREVFPSYHVFHPVGPDSIRDLVKNNPKLFVMHEFAEFSGNFDSKDLGTLLPLFMPQFLREKGVALVDISGFSAETCERQLTLMLSLTSALRTATTRAGGLASSLDLPPFFETKLTGDGAYIWHQGYGVLSDLVTLVCGLLLMLQYSQMRSRGEFDMAVRCAFSIGSCYVFYDPIRITSVRTEEEENADEQGSATGRSPEIYHSTVEAPADILGPLPNTLNRLITVARPNQILIGDFRRSSQRGEGVLKVKQYVKGALEVAMHPYERALGYGVKKSELSLDPSEDTPYRFETKHGHVIHCYNLRGQIPNKVDIGTDKEAVDVFSVGLEVDSSPDIGAEGPQVRFREPVLDKRPEDKIYDPRAVR